MSDTPLVIAIPSKGRIMDEAQSLFQRAGFTVQRSGSARGYRGTIEGLPGTDVAFLTDGRFSGGSHA